jgi:hypothetical protein
MQQPATHVLLGLGGPRRGLDSLNARPVVRLKALDVQLERLLPCPAPFVVCKAIALRLAIQPRCEQPPQKSIHFVRQLAPIIRGIR